MFDANNEMYKVFGDFDASSNMSWTLVQSYELRKHEEIKSFSKDTEKNSDNPASWQEYRLSLSKIKTIWGDSTKLRLTCNYIEPVAVIDEQMIISKENYDIFESGRRCVRVHYINVVGRSCSNCTVLLAQWDTIALHFRSGGGNNDHCEFWNNGSSGCRINRYFGYYECRNRNHACSKSENSTTQTWFGGE